MRKKDIRDDRGVIMLEGAIAMYVVMVVLCFLLSLGFYLYQHTIVVYVSNEVAEEVAQTYKYKDVVDSSNLTEDDVLNVGLFRHSFSAGKNMRSANVKKAQKLINKRLPATSLAQQRGGIRVTIDAETSDIGRSHLIVTASANYNFLFERVLKMFGMKDVGKVSHTTYVENVDILDYVNTVKTTDYGLKKLSGAVPLLNMVDSVIQLMQSLFNIFIK